MPTQRGRVCSGPAHVHSQQGGDGPTCGACMVHGLASGRPCEDIYLDSLQAGGQLTPSGSWLTAITSRAFRMARLSGRMLWGHR